MWGSKFQESTRTGLRNLEAVDIQKSSYRSVQSTPIEADNDPSYSFVGAGHGKFEKVQDTTVRSWKLKKEWASVLIVCTLVAFAVLGTLLVAYVPFGVGGASAAPTQPDAVSSSQVAAGAGAPLRSATLVDYKSPGLRPVVPVLSSQPLAYPAGREASVAQPLPYNCLDGLADSQASWTQAKTDWCCTHQHRGCPLPLYDCNLDRSYGLASVLSTWPVAKRHWCCSTHMVGCPPTTTATATTSTVTTITATSSTATSTTETQTTYGFQCQGSSLGWQLPQKVWCCRRYGKGCVSSPPAAARSVDSSKNLDREVSAAVDKAALLHRKLPPWAAVDKAKIRQDTLPPTKPPTLPATLTSQKPSPVPWAEDTQFDCDDGLEETWSTEHELWCYWHWQAEGKAESAVAEAAAMNSPLR